MGEKPCLMTRASPSDKGLKGACTQYIKNPKAFKVGKLQAAVCDTSGALHGLVAVPDHETLSFEQLYTSSCIQDKGSLPRKGQGLQTAI